jgi:ABC-type cobalamin/Fe3+-siderophores transport system ATPase subunit|tara:strand:- start:4359 stop:5675 length:1317 start_codon:yes stop_codon:yes gene_type:complete
MSFVKTITTNIKSRDGQSKTFELGKHTLLVGPNESGKSAIAEAVQLALTGSAFGLLYRNKPIKAGNQLEVLRPDGAEVVYSQATLDTGESAEWILESGKRPKRNGAEGYAIPMNDLRAVLAGSDQSIRAFFYDHMVQKTDRDDIRNYLSDTIKDTFDEYVYDEDSLSLTKVIAGVGKQKREESAKVKAAKQMLEQMDASYIDDNTISALWLQLAESQRLERLKEMYKAYREDGEETRVLDKIKASLASIGSKEKIQEMISPEDARKNLEDAYLKMGKYKACLGLKNTVDWGESVIDRLNKLEKALIDVVPAVMKDNLVWENYADTVNDFLPKGDEFTVVDNGTVKLGLRRPNGLHVALSGSTEARTLAAMSAALIKNEDSNVDKLSIIVVDDRMWDTATLAKTMKELEAVDCQVIMMSTQKPRGRAREAWTYIDLEKS